jgi:hypothetical protein
MAVWPSLAGILSEPIKGMGVIVNNITILRTGAIEAGGFA